MTVSDVIGVGAFVVLATLWAAFAVAVVGSRPALDATWGGVRALPLALEGLVWLLALPVMVALAVWEGAWRTRSWPVVVRLLVITGSAIASLNALYTRGGR
jgi:hypothetical protein